MTSSEPPPLVALRGRQRIAPFALVRVGDTAAAAEAALAGAVPMGGGVDLVDRMKFGERIERLMPLSGLALGGVEATEGGLRIGATTTYAALAESAEAARLAPAFARLVGGVANPRIRMKGTVGGSVMSQKPNFDVWPALMALGADLVFADGDGEARLPAAALAPDERRLLLAVEVPAGADARFAFDRSLRPIVSVFAGREAATGALRLAVGCAHQRPLLLRLAAGETDVAAAAAAALPPPKSDGLASSTYRRRMVGVLAARLARILPGPDAAS
ncbi:FAD binding domain-containing protein [Acuticoccus mangrovi]|uniref:FAD binding domain-containing protein n=1 Tax=Acuticoccus mangrovi TaxID=2796142 RepID=A0A934IFD6_9HYPH|nr:FAD binding domain-containing protein [Acuticoccus mangrovi]